MEITEKQLTEELVITPEAMQEALADMDKQLTAEKGFDLLFEIVQQSQKGKQGKIEGIAAIKLSREPIPLAKLCWIARQAFIMGFAHGLDLYNEVVKGFIADFSGGYGNLTVFFYRLLSGKNELLRGHICYV